MKSLIANVCVLLSAFCLLAQEAPQPAPAQTPALQPAASAAMPPSEEFVKAVYFGKKFAEIKDYASAYQQFAKADLLQPDVPGVLYNMGVLLARTGRFSEAQAKVDRYNQLFPNGAEKPLVARLQLELEFEREVQKKRQVDEEYTAIFTRGRYLYTKGDLPAALKLFQDAEQQRPTDPAAVFNQGVVYEKFGDLPKASERFHRYEELEPDATAKSTIDQRILGIESEMSDMKTKIICPFCGFRLPIGATWCPHCWHGPYLTSQSAWSSRPCSDGATATRATYFADDRFAKNESLPCLFNGTMLEALRYTPARQQQVQDARKAEGWTYAGDILQSWHDRQGNEIRYVQGADYLEKITSSSSGDMLTFAAHKTADASILLLDREDVVIDGQKYTVHYTFDAQSRIAQEQVVYQNAAGCDDVVTMTADVTYASNNVSTVKIRGGYNGTVVQGSPRLDWEANITFAYDTNDRLTKEELALTAMTKTYNERPYGAERQETGSLYQDMRVRKPIDRMLSAGDRCGISGTQVLGNPVDLRPFYALTPNLAIVLGNGVTRASVSFTYPDSYRVR
ncbi:MAG TPA: tetratricopeptide repeat protein [Thermoanaerobaculia bacterium]|jgi:Flp pilus assembly protein TadD/ribosomal protein L40E|nr:tetratricopeptide repeat protein [Thermoanaerobaculia bacterium]